MGLAASVHSFLSGVKFRVAAPLSQKVYWSLMGWIRAVPAVTSNLRRVEDCLDSGVEPVEFMERLGVVQPAAVTLQIGCGIGRIEYHLASRVRRCYGIDISPSMIAKARRYVTTPNAAFLCTNGERLDWPDEPLDLIYSYLVFQHLPRPRVRAYVQQARRKLRAGGTLVFQVPVALHGRDIVEPPSSHPYGMRYYQVDHVRHLALEGGFASVALVAYPTAAPYAGQESVVAVCRM